LMLSIPDYTKCSTAITLPSRNSAARIKTSSL
jgi:hypothetical protein